MTNKSSILLSPEELALLTKMALIPMKIQSKLDPKVIEAAVFKLVESGELTAEEIPTREEMKAMDSLAEKLGLPKNRSMMN